MITAFSWLAENWMEIAGTLSALLYLYLSIRENIWLWPVGFVTSFFYMLIFFQSRLYADMGLQVYYLWVSVYGWFHWMGRRQVAKPETQLETRCLSPRGWLTYLALVLAGSVVLYYALLFVPLWLGLPPSELPLGDAFTTAGGIVATWMLARKILENWLFWVVVNAVSLGMYVYKDLQITAGLFVVYTLMAVVGYYRWKQNLTQTQ